MTAFSDYLEQKIVDWSLRNTAMGTAPTSVWVALHSADPGDAGASNEISGNAYAREEVSTTGGWTAHGTGGPTENVAEILFPTATPSGWGTVSHFSIWDAVSGGNCLYKGALTTPRTVAASDTFRFVAGALQITLA